ncbi:FecR family protein [Nitrosomonas aestuarii]|uniref:FecR family protein n=1 Tax=Nitrosomonas aestuarii TaxID=52441 RepID=UPI000D323122|nr:FecR family protein [Nitrosomonas aestuarii]PTN11937.1 FecR family protein [Nitrosomonas aestuarii]
MSAPKPSDPSPKKPFVFSWRRLFIHLALFSVCAFLGLMSWHLSKPQSIRLHETKPGEYLNIKVTPDIYISLDSSSSFAITDNEPLRIELFRGNTYFDIKKNPADHLTIKVGDTLIEDIGTRFSVRMQKNGNHILSVAQGQVKVHVVSGVYLISALEQADFDGYKVSKHRMISEREVAPWHSDRITP